MSQNPEFLLVSDAGGRQGNVVAYDVDNGQILTSYKGATSETGTLCVCHDEFLISAIPNKAVIQVYNMNKKSQQSVKNVLPGVVKSLCISHDSSMIVAGIAEKVLIWESAGGELLAILTRHYQNVTSLDFSHDDGFLVSSGEDGIVAVWDVADVWDRQGRSSTIEALHTWTSHTLPVSAAIFGLRHRLYTSSLDNSIKIHDVPSRQIICTLVLDSAITSLALGSAEVELFAGSSKGQIFKVNFVSCGHAPNELARSNVSSKVDKQMINAHEKTVTCLCVSLDTSYFVSGSMDMKVKVWDTHSLQCLRTIKCDGAVTNARLVLLTPFFNSSTTRPTHIFPKLAHQITSDGDESSKKYFVIGGSESSDDEGFAKDLISKVLYEAPDSQKSPSLASLSYENEKLRAENETLYQYAVEHAINKAVFK